MVRSSPSRMQRRGAGRRGAGDALLEQRVAWDGHDVDHLLLREGGQLGEDREAADKLG